MTHKLAALLISCTVTCLPLVADEMRVPRSTIERGLEWRGAVLEEKDFTLWDVSPVHGDDGKVHLFVGRWPETNVDPAWRKSSEIAHYVGNGPEGPFRFHDVVLKGTGADTWDKFAPHNPEVRRIGDTYVLTYIANNDFHQPPHPRNQRIGMAVAPSLEGPWRKVGRNGLILEPSSDKNHWTHGSQVVNPTLLKVGAKFHLYFKSLCQGQKGTVYGVAVSDQLEGPYQITGQPLTTKGVMIEDGFVFEWKGKICLISTDNHGDVTGVRGGGALWVSDDGFHFNPAWTQCAFERIPAYFHEYDPAKVKRIYGPDPKLERPKLLMENGDPAWLYASSGWNVTGGVRTVIHALKVNLKPGDGPLPRTGLADQASAASGPMKADGRAFTVMSFNVLEGGGDSRSVGFPDSLFGGGRRDDIANVIRECDADIVGVQECGDVAWLLKELGPGWHGIGRGSSKYTSAIVSRFPLVPLVSDDFLTAARVSVPAGEVIVVNAHWWPPKNSGAPLILERMKAGTVPAEPVEFEKQILAASDASAGPRGYDRTLAVLRPHLAAGARIVLTGDFNESSHLDWTERAARSGIDRWPGNPTGRPLRFKIAWKGSKLLSEAGLPDAYRVAHPDEVAKPGITWTPRYDPSPGRRPYDDQVLERVDRIHFSTDSLKVLGASVVGEDPATCEQVHQGRWVSDHRAVKATFTMTGTGSETKTGSKTPPEPTLPNPSASSSVE